MAGGVRVTGGRRRFDNEGTLNVVQNLNSNGPDVSGGTVDIASGNTWSLDYSNTNAGFTQTAGAINSQGTFLLNDGTFTASGGTSTGNPLTVGSDNAGVNIDLAGSASDSVHAQTGAARLTGDIGAGDTLWSSGEPGFTQGLLTAMGAYTNHGTLELGSASDQTDSTLKANAGTVTNAGTIVFENTNGGGGDSLSGPLLNTGTLSLTGSVSGTGQITNQGTVSLAGGVTLSAASFAQAVPGTLSVGIVAGSSALQNPVVQLTGTASLGGALGVTTSGSQTSAVTLVQAASVSGTFPAPQFTGETYTLAYTPTSVSLSPGAPTKKPTPTKPTSGGKVRVGGVASHSGKLTIKLSCPTGTATCSAITIRATVTEQLKAAKRKAKGKTKVVTVASAKARLAAAKGRTITLKLNRAGLALLKSHHKLQVTVTITSGGKVVKRSKVEVRVTPAKKKRPKK